LAPGRGRPRLRRSGGPGSRVDRRHRERGATARSRFAGDVYVVAVRRARGGTGGGDWTRLFVTRGTGSRGSRHPRAATPGAAGDSRMAPRCPVTGTEHRALALARRAYTIVLTIGCERQRGLGGG